MEGSWVRRAPPPLLFARLALFAMRSAHCLGKATRGDTGGYKAQLYVDDPAISMVGTRKTNLHTIDAILLCWFIIDLPLAWNKGAVYREEDPHIWIGVTFSLHKGTTVTMEIPAEYLEELDTLLRPFTNGTKQVSIGEAERAVGQAGRVSHIIKEAHPFTWGNVCRFHREQTGRRVRP